MMAYYALVFITALLITLSLFLLKNSFFSFALATTSLLNVMLDSTMEEQVKQRLLIKTLVNFLLKFVVFLFIIIAAVALSLVPMALFMKFSSFSISDLDLHSYKFYLSMIAGSAVPFLIPRNKKKKNYSEWSILLHKMLMDNYNISKALFSLEKRFFKKKLLKNPAPFVIVSGLARAGTTALTNLLFQSNEFHSLSYANMPFLLSVNLWGKFYNPGKSKLKQRAHGDKIMVGYNSIEALEEYFFKVFLNDSFITENTLTEHSINEKVFNEYINYQKLIRPENTDTTYLAKNNNLILRYNSLNTNNAKYKVVLLFRNPIDHALSLKNQHHRFSKLQEKDSFVLEYMNWLGHHEFGLNHKVFSLGLEGLCNPYESTSINYWIAVWINYYSRILSLEKTDNLIIVDYSDLLNTPEKLITALGSELNLNLNLSEVKRFHKSTKPVSGIDEILENKASQIYNELMRLKLNCNIKST